MNRFTFSIALIALLVAVFAMQPCSVAAQASPAAAAQDQAAKQPMLRGAFPTTLVKGLDSKKLKDGDQVVVQTSGPIRMSNSMIPSGSKIYGHVTQAQARSKGDAQSSLAIAFDKVEVTRGKELPMKGVLQAVAPALPGGSGPDTSSMMGSGQMIAGHGDASTMSAPGGVNPSGIHSSDPNAGGAHPVLNNESQGVLGFKNLEMDKSGALVSSGKEVRLDSGTQMMVRAEIQMPAQ